MKKIEVENKSLSARIKRRNASGFNGEGTPSKWVKTSSFGDWQQQPTRKADKAREIGKNANRPLHKHNRNLEFQQMLRNLEFQQMLRNLEFQQMLHKFDKLQGHESNN